MKVDRRVYISQSSFRSVWRGTRSSDPQGAPSIDFWKATTGTGFRIGQYCDAEGAIRLSSASIGREATIKCREVSAIERQSETDRYPLALRLDNASIDGQLEIGESVIRGGVDLSGLQVHGGIELSNLTFQLRDSHAADLPEQPGVRTVLNLRDCSCTNDLTIKGIKWSAPTEKQEGEKKKREWLYKATMFYGDALFESMLALDSSGSVEMRDDDPIKGGLPIRRPDRHPDRTRYTAVNEDIVPFDYAPKEADADVRAKVLDAITPE